MSAVALLASALLAFSRPVELVVDGERVETEVPPVTTASDRVFVPLRSVADALGAEVTSDDKTGRIEVIRGSQTLRVRIGDNHATLNGIRFTLGHPPFRVRGRVMIALHVFTDAFDVRATYDPRTARIDVLTPGIGRATTSTQTNETTQ